MIRHQTIFLDIENCIAHGSIKLTSIYTKWKSISLNYFLALIQNAVNLMA